MGTTEWGLGLRVQGLGLRDRHWVEASGRYVQLSFSKHLATRDIRDAIVPYQGGDVIFDGLSFRVCVPASDNDVAEVNLIPENGRGRYGHTVDRGDMEGQSAPR